jgi:hypothetical protein
MSIVVGASVSEGSFTKNFWVSQEAMLLFF